MNAAQAFGMVIKKWRLSRKFSQSDLAERCDLNRTYISLLEQGHKNASIKTIFKICKALRVPASNLLRQTEIVLHSKNRRSSITISKRL